MHTSPGPVSLGLRTDFGRLRAHADGLTSPPTEAACDGLTICFADLRVRPWTKSKGDAFMTAPNTAATPKRTAKRSKPPFRADHVGSLLRPKHLLEAREKLDKGAISAAELRHVEDEAIRLRLAKRQEDVGLRSITDGEFRRRSWHMDFICRIGGVVSAGTQVRPFHNEKGDVRNEIEVPKVCRAAPPRTADLRRRFPLEPDDHGDAEILDSVSEHVHGLGSTLEDKSVYANAEQVARSRPGLYRRASRSDRLGCTYLQIDDTMFATLADPEYRKKINPLAGAQEQLHKTYIRLLNDSLAQRPAGMTVCVHTCLGQSPVGLGGGRRL